MVPWEIADAELLQSLARCLALVWDAATNIFLHLVRVACALVLLPDESYAAGQPVAHQREAGDLVVDTVKQGFSLHVERVAPSGLDRLVLEAFAAKHQSFAGRVDAPGRDELGADVRSSVFAQVR